MSALAFSSEVKNFINDNITSYEDLQVLLLMHQHPGRNWDAADIAEHLRIEPLSASQHLMNLHQRGLIGHRDKKSPLYQYSYMRHPEPTESKICALAAAFDKARTEVVDYVYKRSRLNSFADAFKLK